MQLCALKKFLRMQQRLGSLVLDHQPCSCTVHNSVQVAVHAAACETDDISTVQTVVQALDDLGKEDNPPGNPLGKEDSGYVGDSTPPPAPSLELLANTIKFIHATAVGTDNYSDAPDYDTALQVN